MTTYPRPLLAIWMALLAIAIACGDNAPANDAGARARDAAAPTTLRVLFVGNSYTSVHELPKIVEALGEAEDVTMRVEAGMHAPGGQTWEGHDADPELAEKLAEGWGVVVLQDQSTQAFSVTGVKPALRSLDAKVRAAGARPVLYMTWARGPAKAGALAVFEQNLDLTRYYGEAGEAIDAPVAPVGRAWERALRDGNTTLHQPDASHPNALGSYLAACVLYETLTGQAALGAGQAGLDISQADASRMQQIAAETARARTRPASPLLGHWPLATAIEGNDVFTTENISIGDAASDERVGTDFSSGGFAVIPYFPGLRTPRITVALWAHREDWSAPTPHPILAETFVARYKAYELYQRGTEIFAQVYTTDGLKHAPLAFEGSGLSSGWHHLALTYDGSEYALWVDGVREAQGVASGELRYADSSVPDFGRFKGIAISGAASGGGTVAVGMVSGSLGVLADLRIYEKSLSAQDIAQLQ